MPNSGRAVDSAVRAILAQDPIWAAYAIADLRPDQARFCRWLVAPDASGLALIYRGLKPPILLCVGPADGVAAALADAELPAHAFLSVRQQHLPPLLQHYAQIDKQEMLRSTWPAGRQAPAPLQPTVRLGCADGQRLEALYGCGGFSLHGNPPTKARYSDPFGSALHDRHFPWRWILSEHGPKDVEKEHILCARCFRQPTAGRAG